MTMVWVDSYNLAMFSSKSMTPIDRELSKRVVKIIHGLLMMEESAPFRKPVPHKGTPQAMQHSASRTTRPSWRSRPTWTSSAGRTTRASTSSWRRFSMRFNSAGTTANSTMRSIPKSTSRRCTSKRPSTSSAKRSFPKCGRTSVERNTMLDSISASSKMRSWRSPSEQRRKNSPNRLKTSPAKNFPARDTKNLPVLKRWSLKNRPSE